MTVGARGDGRGAAWAIGACRAGGGGSRCSTPHLTSPLEGGRDELGKGWVLGWVGSCLRRNDGKEARNGGGEGRGGEGRGAGMTERGAG